MKLHTPGMDKIDDGPGGQSTSRLRVVIAEDQPESAQWLVDTLKKLRPTWTICAVARNPRQLLEAVEESVPGLLILDVHLIGGTSLEVLSQLPYPVPIVFTSGDPSFAVEAFEHAAIDYILKPLRSARLERGLRRVEATRVMSGLPASRGGEQQGWIVAHKADGMLIVRLREIIYLQARGKFTLVVTKLGEAFIKRGIGLVEQHLDPSRFVRIHRSTIINFDHAGLVMRDDLARMRIQMRGRTEWLDISQTFELPFKAHLSGDTAD